ncbi:hypothetical protein GPROT1_02713 [Gammaproteobacteria bacterium]|nr:hypothetical protein GPROT1_02713 [Gammaproteobacteria bacterium]
MPLPLDELVENPELVNQSAQALEWAELLFEFEHALDDATALLLGLSDDQLRFKPAAKAFSIAEGLTHALHSDELFWSWIKLLMDGRRAEIDPAALIGGDGAQPDQAGTAIATLIENVHLIARGTIELRPDPIDLHSTAPHPYFGELNAKGWLMFMALHHGMHLRQCEAVIDAPGFPRGTSKQSLTAEEYLQPRERKTWLKPDAGGKRQDAGSKKSAVKKKPAGAKKPAGKRVTRR